MDSCWYSCDLQGGKVLKSLFLTIVLCSHIISLGASNIGYMVDCSILLSLILAENHMSQFNTLVSR